MTAEPAAPELVLGRYGELWLKGKNRHLFERALVRNARRAIEPIGDARISRESGLLVVRPGRRVREVARRLQEVFGLSSVSPAWTAEPGAEGVARTARAVLASALAAAPEDRPIRFRVETRRADKSFPMTSVELDRFVAERVIPEHGDRLVVDLTRPELTLGIHVRREGVRLFAERLQGAGGLPVGTVGRAVVLLSGGIDSPVAAWMAMKRGLEAVLVTFHSPRFLGEGAVQKVTRLARELARWQPRTRLVVVPFTDPQIAVRDGAPEAYRTVLYRRAMQRIAAKIAEAEDSGAIVTGESLGQVASQTLENVTCIQAAAPTLVLRPLVGFDKAETIALARRIGTYEISIEPEADCCTVFQPMRPALRASPERCAAIEARLGMDELVEAAARDAERIDL